MTNGTGGAWEFIDLKIAQAREDRVRYAVPTVQLYAGHSGENTLADVNDLFAGFMLLPRVGVGKNVHEVSQVRAKFTLTSRARGSLPLILDLKERTMTITDVGIRSGVNVIESGPVVKAMFELFAHYAPFTVADYLNLTGATVVGKMRKLILCFSRRLPRSASSTGIKGCNTIAHGSYRDFLVWSESCT